MRHEIYCALQDLLWAGADGWLHKHDISCNQVPNFLQNLRYDGLVERRIERYNQHYYHITFKGLWAIFQLHGKF